MKKLAAVCCLFAMAVPLSIGAAAAAVSQQKEILRGDVNGDGKVSINDVTEIQKYLADFDNVYGIGEPIDFNGADMDVTGDLPDVSVFGTENNVTLKVWASDKALALTKQQVETFKAAYPGKTFRITVEAQGEFDASTMLINDASNAADVMMIPSDQLNKLEDAMVLAEPMFTDTVYARDTADAVMMATTGNHLSAYPMTNDNGYYLVYDNSVISAQQAGRLEDVLAACKTAGKQFVMDNRNGFYSCVFAFTAGAIIDGYEADGATQKFVAYDENEAVKTLQAFAKLLRSYKGTFVSEDVAGIAAGFMNKTVGAGIDGVWNQTADMGALGTRFGAAKLPTIQVNSVDKQMIPMCGYKLIGVNLHSAYPRSAQILASYLSGEACQQQRAEQLGWGSTNRKVQQSAAITGNPVLKALGEQAAFAVPQVNIAPTFWSAMGNLGYGLLDESVKPSNTTYYRNLLRQTIQMARDE